MHIGGRVKSVAEYCHVAACFGPLHILVACIRDVVFDLSSHVVVVADVEMPHLSTMCEHGPGVSVYLRLGSAQPP